MRHCRYVNRPPVASERLAVLVPTPRMHLTGDHGVFAPHSQYRAAVTPAQRGRGAAMLPVSGADPTKPSTASSAV